MEGKKPIAIVCYAPEGHDLYSKELFTQEEIDLVKSEQDPDVASWKSILIFGDNLRSEDYT